MPTSPKLYRPPGYKPRDERTWASRRAAYRKWYSCARWHRLRKQVLSEQPLCPECEKEGHLVPATHVDHKIPHEGDIEAFYRREGLQALCHAHHSAKTASSDGGFGNRKGQQ